MFACPPILALDAVLEEKTVEGSVTVQVLHVGLAAVNRTLVRQGCEGHSDVKRLVDGT